MGATDNCEASSKTTGESAFEERNKSWGPTEAVSRFYLFCLTKERMSSSHHEEQQLTEHDPPSPTAAAHRRRASSSHTNGNNNHANASQEHSPLSPPRTRKCLEIGPEEEDELDRSDGLIKKTALTHSPGRLRSRLAAIPRLRQRRHYNAALAYPSSEDETDGEDNHNHRRQSNHHHALGDDDTVTGNWSLDDEDDTPVVLNEHDIRLCQELDNQYEQALEDRQVAWSARYQSVRQSTLLSILLMCLLILTGTLFFLRQADNYWTVPEALLFSIYTITTVGYGHLDMPDTVAFQMYTVCFIFLGIAMLTILVAQVYQCISLEASRVAVHAGDAHIRRHSMRRWLETTIQENRQSHHTNNTAMEPFDTATWMDAAEGLLKGWDKLRTFLRENEYGRGLSVVLPFLGLVLFGSIVIGPLEGWSFTESIYFSVVSLTTVGFGDYYPTRTVSIWFTCLWLPFSVGFMSLYLANVAAFYIRLSDRNVARIERVLRRRLQRAKERAEQERRAVLRRALRGQDGRRLSSNSSGISSSDDDLALSEEVAPETPNDVEEADPDGNPVDPSMADREGTTIQIMSLSAPGQEPVVENDSNTTRHLFGTEGATLHRRERILQNSQRHTEFTGKNSKALNRKTSGSGRSSMATMRDVLRTVRRNNAQIVSGAAAGGDSSVHGSVRQDFQAAGPEREFLSVKAIHTVLHHDSRNVRKKPSFALRALVQERFAKIIATDIAGYQSSIEIKDFTLKVTIQSLKQTADKWLVPRRARKAFRAVAFEALYFVGEHGLITRGADALFSLTPFEFHQIFSPLLAALGDAETMELWLEHTQTLADVDLVNEQSLKSSSPMRTTTLSYRSEGAEQSPTRQRVTEESKGSASDDDLPSLS